MVKETDQANSHITNSSDDPTSASDQLKRLKASQLTVPKRPMTSAVAGLVSVKLTVAIAIDRIRAHTGI
jgi:hypothetical protein